MDRRTQDLELLRKARQELDELARLEASITQTENRISALHTEMGSLPTWKERYSTTHEAGLLAEYNNKSKSRNHSKKKAIGAISICISCIIFILSCIFYYFNFNALLVDEPDYRVIFIIAHIAVNIAIILFEIATCAGGTE